MSQDFNVNGIVFVITDGLNNESKSTPSMIADTITKAKYGEEIESLITILVGINTKEKEVSNALDEFASEAKLSQYVDAGDATSQRLAKLASFVSKSVSSQSQALGTGGPSQILTI
jgi:hypothetical protein